MSLNSKVDETISKFSFPECPSMSADNPDVSRPPVESPGTSSTSLEHPEMSSIPTYSPDISSTPVDSPIPLNSPDMLPTPDEPHVIPPVSTNLSTVSNGASSHLRPIGTTTDTLGATPGGVIEAPVTPSAGTGIFALPTDAEDQLSNEDENLLKYFVMLRRTGPAATALAKICKQLYKGGQQTVKDYCISVLGKSMSQYKKLFNATERDVLDSGTDWNELDITFLYKLLQNVCGLAPSYDAKWTNPSPQDLEALEHLLNQIKGERNFLAHEAVVLSNGDLLLRTQTLETLLIKSLTASSVIANEDNTRDIETMKKTMKDVMNSSSRISLQAYQKELEEVRGDLVSRVREESHKELRMTYQQLWHDVPQWWGDTQPSDTPPAVENMHQVDQVFTEVTVTMKNEEVVPLLTLFNQKLPDKTLPRLLILEGLAGVGKSHACRYILNYWAINREDSDTLVSFDVLIFLQCHSVASGSLREYLAEELLQKTFNTVSHDDIIPSLRECHLGFIIDGLDEAGSKARFLVKEIGAKFPASQVLITCRPEFKEEAKRLISPKSNSYRIFYLQGFNDVQRLEYIGKLFCALEGNENQQEGMKQKFIKQLQEIEEDLSSLVCLPLTVMMIILVWIQNTDLLTNDSPTVTRLYKHIVEFGIKRLTERLQQKHEETRHSTEIESACWDWLLTLAKVANKALEQNTLIIDFESKSELIQKAHTHNIDSTYAMSSFLKYKMRRVFFGFCNYEWEFLHRAYQEYLAAYYQCHRPEPRIDLVLGRKCCITLTSDSSGSSSPGSWSSSTEKSSDTSFEIENLKKKMQDVLEPLSDRNNLSHKEMEPMRKTEIRTSDRFSSGESLNPGDLDDSKINTYNPQNKLIFAAAMEVSKDEIKEDKLEDIVKEFSQTVVSTEIWISWYNLIRECGGNKMVCNLVRSYFDGKEIRTWNMRGKIIQNFRAIQYLLQKTRFSPKLVELWIGKEDPFPLVLSHILKNLGELEISVAFHCSVSHCNNLLKALKQQDTLSHIDLTIDDVFHKEAKDISSLLQFFSSEHSDFSFKLSLIMKELENLCLFADVCTNLVLPSQAILSVRICFFAVDMLVKFKLIFDALTWHRAVTISFTDDELRNDAHALIPVISKALIQADVKVTHIKLLVKAYAESVFECYKDLAVTLAGDSLVEVVFESGADGDDVEFIITGKKNKLYP